MNRLTLILFTFMWLFMNNPIRAQQIPTTIIFNSIPGGPFPEISTTVYQTDNLTGVSVGSVTVELCTYTLGGQPPSSCFGSCSSILGNDGSASCHLNLSISPGEYTLFAIYDEGGGFIYQNSEVRQNVAGDFGGGISPI
jgi:hypothetical protein